MNWSEHEAVGQKNEVKNVRKINFLTCSYQFKARRMKCNVLIKRFAFKVIKSEASIESFPLQKLFHLDAMMVYNSESVQISPIYKNFSLVQSFLQHHGDFKNVLKEIIKIL